MRARPDWGVTDLDSDTLTLTRGHGPLMLPEVPHLRLASGNFWPEEVGGELTAGLFIIDTRTSPSKQEHVRVRPAQVVEVDGATLEIVKVGPYEEGGEPAIQLRVRVR